MKQAVGSPEPQNAETKTPADSWLHGRRLWLIAGLGVALIVVVGLLLAFVFLKRDNKKDAGSSVASTAVNVGQSLSHGQCTGEGVTHKLSVSPMKPEDFGIVVPYGLMIGAHVTPIDHQYFSPKDYNSPVDAYEVRAMGDAHIVDISTRPRSFGQEYRLVFSVSCTYFYYYDLVTSLSPTLKAAYESRGGRLDVPVKAGEVIGRIGGQTLDFAVWDTTKPLTGFVVPAHYKQAEGWKIYTADPLNYYTDSLKSLILSRYVRTAEPISGKIDYDIDGKLIGNWFVEGTNGYGGDTSDNHSHYWTTHLSFSPNLYAPDWFIVSIGDWETKDGPGGQFVTTSNAPNPKDVSVETGLVKYELANWSYTTENGSIWNQNSLTPVVNVVVNTQEPIQGCALVQMTEKRKLTFEAFRDKPCSDVSGFTSAAKTYTR